MRYATISSKRNDKDRPTDPQIMPAVACMCLGSDQTKFFAESGAIAAFSTVSDGIELMDYLSGHSRSEEKRLPDLMLLDLNMPRKDGRQALVEIKSDPALRHIPIVILTTSEEQADIDLTTEAGAESFITKPATFDAWVQIMKSLAKRRLR